MKKHDFKMYKNLVFLSQIAFMMVTPIFGGVLLGNWIDQKLGTKGIFLLICIVLGVGVAFLELFKFIMKNTKPPKGK
jgi:F0F1-type ATP synthase assembly protein I